MAPSLLLLSLLVATATAQSMMNMDMVCLRLNSVNDYCDVQTTCSRCVRAEGCAFDMLAYNCVAAPTNGRPLYERSSNPLLNRTSYTYCADGDPVCTGCFPTTTRPVCEGQNGCICPSMCNLLRAAQQSCYDQRQGYMMYVSIAAMALVLPLLVMLQRRCSRGRTLEQDDIRAEMRRRLILQQRQREREYQRPPSALALELEAWRSHRDANNIDVGKLELKQCYMLMEEKEPEVATGSRHEGDVEDAHSGAKASEKEAMDLEGGFAPGTAGDDQLQRTPSSVSDASAAARATTQL